MSMITNCVLHRTTTIVWCSAFLALAVSTNAYAQEGTDSEEVSTEAVERIIDSVLREVVEERARAENRWKENTVSRDAYQRMMIESPDAQQQTVSAHLVQGTASVFEPLSGTIVEDTSNPQRLSALDSKPDIVRLVAARGVAEPHIVLHGVDGGSPVAVIPGPASLYVVAEAISAGSVLGSSTILREDLAFISIAQPATRPDYHFELTGSEIKTKRGNARVAIPTIDNQSGVMTISGSCSSVYYTILLFRNETEYQNRDAFVSKSYLCIDGEYSFALNTLPARIPSGTYFLLIGESAEAGAWTPKTNLVEIVITNTQ